MLSCSFKSTGQRCDSSQNLFGW